MFLSRRHIALLAILAGSLTGVQAHAQTAAPAAKKSTAQAATLKVSTLKGKFAFTLPAGYTANPLPAGNAQNGTAGASGVMYLNEAQRRVVIATEVPANGAAAPSDDDREFLDGAVAGFLKQQAESVPDFKQIAEKRLKHKGLGIRQIESTATLGGGKTLCTTFIAGSGETLSLVQVISRADDPSGHEAMVRSIAATR